MSDDEHTELNDLLNSVGLGIAPITREDEVFNRLTEGSVPKIDNVRVMLAHQMALFHYLTKKENKKITTDVMADGKAVAKQLSNTEYGKLILKFYLNMYHLAWFVDLNNGQPKADIGKVLDMLLEHSDIKAVIEKKWG